MKRNLIIIFLLLIFIFTLCSCEVHQAPSSTGPLKEIPKQSINYIDFTVGNVIQDGKQAIFFNFASDYVVEKMEIAGTLLDSYGNIIHSFDTLIKFGTPSYNPEMAVRVEKSIIKDVKSVSFSKIKAYTLEEFNEEKTQVLKLIVTANESTIDNYYATGSTITVVNGEINIDLNKNTSGCGFRWNLSEENLKPNTKYMIKFENISAMDVRNTSIQLETTWVDSTYPFPRYYHVKGKRFDTITSGEISNDYYQFLKSKKYDEYTIEFTFTHSVDHSESKKLYFNFMGVKEQLLIGNLSIYEITYA